MSPAFLLIGTPPAGSPPNAAAGDDAAPARTARLADWMQWLTPSATASPAEVLLISSSCFTDPAWPFVRVRLAESGRFFCALLPARSSSAALVAALREGAYEAFTANEPPARQDQALQATAAAEHLWHRLFAQTAAASVTDQLIGHSAALQRIRDLIARVGPTSASVLLLGESGTGKERVAQALHAARPGDGPFVALNCTALPRDLLEGELFGATKGAYTGATGDRPGLVEQAHGGTLFLDEIGDLDPALQPKLLRFLETRRARRLGARTDYAVEVRIIAATHADLPASIATGRFREDLYYRLAEFTLELPALRERTEDIPALCRHFLAVAAERHGKLVTSMEPALVARFQEWSWPGNIRELRSTLDRLVILANGPVLLDSAWQPPRRPVLPSATAALPTTATPAAVASDLPLNKRQRRELALRLLEESGGDQAWVAARLGIHPTTLYRWRQK